MTDRRPPNPPRPAPAAGGFTLIELMVSIALVLIIILGVNAIFKMASDTVNAGQALASANRDNRAVQSVIYNDFATAVINDGPLLLIRSERVPAFRNREDETNDRDGNPLTVDVDANNKEGEPTVRGEVTAPFIYNTRNHRVDRVSFFASHLFRRQTGTESIASYRMIDDGASPEAYIWYGHLDQPNGKALSGTPGRFEHKGPGEVGTAASPNTNNFYATDWILGRSVTLLRDVPVPPNTPTEYVSNYIAAPSSLPSLAPLSPEAQSKDKDGTGVTDLFSWSRYDLAQTSISTYKLILENYISSPTVGGHKIETNSVWYEILGGEWGTGGNSARFHGYPYANRPLTAYGASQTVPVFVRGCTQFIVEYAGDYLSQDAEGKIVGSYLNGQQGTDGQIDFLMVDEQPHPSEPLRKVKRIRWYGMPRNVDLMDDKTGPRIGGMLSAGPKHEGMYDVIPLRDLLLLAPGPEGGENRGIPDNFFEHFENLEPLKDYASPSAGQVDPKKLRYYAAWSPDDLRPGSLTRPKMLRITMTVDDPNGRLTEGQTFEYVINLP